MAMLYPDPLKKGKTIKEFYILNFNGLENI